MRVGKAVLGCGFCLTVWMSQSIIAQTAPTASPTASGHKIRVLILTGSSDWSHPWEGTAPFMQGILMNTGRFDVKLEEEVRGITAETLANYDVLLDYYYGPRWGDTTEKAIADFVRSGKGMVAVHGVLYGPFFGQAGGSPTEPRRLEGPPWQDFIDGWHDVGYPEHRTRAAACIRGEVAGSRQPRGQGSAADIRY